MHFHYNFTNLFNFFKKCVLYRILFGVCVWCVGLINIDFFFFYDCSAYKNVLQLKYFQLFILLLGLNVLHCNSKID